MDSIRKLFGGLLATLGLYYCALGGSTLIRLRSATTQWIQQSGDPDFTYDYGTFLILTGLGAAFVGLLGCLTLVRGVATVRGRPASWLGLAVAAVTLHWFWFLHRIIGSGFLDHGSQAVVRRNTAIQFGCVCVAYVLMWIITRRQHSDRLPGPGLQPTVAGGIMPRRG